MESLYRNRWTSLDGVGALVIAPTRELALQIFEVLRAVGKHHSFSAGLIIGGKAFEDEQAHIGKMNILVCTPGRLLQRMRMRFLSFFFFFLPLAISLTHVIYRFGTDPSV